MRQPHRLAAGLATFTGTRAGPPAKRLRGLGGVRPYNFAGRVSVDLHKSVQVQPSDPKMGPSLGARRLPCGDLRGRDIMQQPRGAAPGPGGTRTAICSEIVAGVSGTSGPQPCPVRARRVLQHERIEPAVLLACRAEFEKVQS